MLPRLFLLNFRNNAREIGPTIVSKPQPVNASVNQLLCRYWDRKLEICTLPDTKLRNRRQLDTRLEFAILTRESQLQNWRWHMMQRMLSVVSVVTIAVVIGGLASDTQGQGRTKIRYALGDVISIDELPLLIAVEQAKQRGVDVEVTAFKSEEVATQAVINGQADVGQGTPYAAIQKVTVPIRFFYQLSALQFFPVVNKESYKSWKDLDGQEIAVQGRGSGTEAIMILAAKEHGIKYKNVSYVPGSQVRALALLKGNIKATILD